MDTKHLIWIGMFVGSSIGGLLPGLFFDSGSFSMATIFCSTVGGLLGIWGGYKLSQMV